MCRSARVFWSFWLVHLMSFEGGRTTGTDWMYCYYYSYSADYRDYGKRPIC